MGKLGPKDNAFNMYEVGSPSRDPSAETRPLKRATISMKGWARGKKKSASWQRELAREHIFLGLGSKGQGKVSSKNL